ncbi:YhdT family protein [Peptoniphilus stercorisuis]|uniref:Membrane protein YhdT n=1 Tax=Peptoniphilus stercorisuis TaxID=1436965 RepID=A0ABS4KBJ5_9FIRM|nr:putative membrane protein YhdT [Peptoniphilus stercorisuis]
MNSLKTIEEKNRQINKETKISIFLYILYFLWWYLTGYGLSNTDPSEYKYILGLPLWFFLSCVVGYIWFCIATIIVTKFFFKNFNLEDED